MSNDFKPLCTEQTLRLLRFFFLKIITLTILLREQIFQILRRLAGNVLNGNTIADVGSVVRMALRGVDVQIPDELVVNDKALGFIFARPLRFVHVNVVDELVEHLLSQCTHFHKLTYSGVSTAFPRPFCMPTPGSHRSVAALALSRSSHSHGTWTLYSVVKVHILIM